MTAQVLSSPADQLFNPKQADIWSCGVLLFAMLQVCACRVRRLPRWLEAASARSYRHAYGIESLAYVLGLDRVPVPRCRASSPSRGPATTRRSMRRRACRCSSTASSAPTFTSRNSTCAASPVITLDPERRVLQLHVRIPSASCRPVACCRTPALPQTSAKPGVTTSEHYSQPSLPAG